MTELIDSLTIRGFRGFSELTIPKFGRVNLLTGKNNAGKSSVLEAIRILVSKGSPDTLRTILQYREEMPEFRTPGPQAYEFATDKGGFELVRSLFRGFPDVLTHGPAAFSIHADGKLSRASSSLSIRTAWMIERFEEGQHVPRYWEAPDDMFAVADGRPALSYRVGEHEHLLSVASLLRASRSGADVGGHRSGEGSAELGRYVYLDPFNSKSTRHLGELWDAIALTDVQDEVLKALQLVSPDIQAISMIGGEGFGESGSRIAIVRSSRFLNRIPLRSYGDGMNRLFGIILSLCNARNGILLIDEFENGLHYSVQPLVWQTIFQLAQHLDVQVFATTHSRDCVLAFQQAAAASPANGHLIRLTRKDDQVLPTVFSEDDLQLVADNDIEVR